ncbi:Hemerythrin [Parvularcula bermudensis HTCC2503]|uniref:Hemerythrin n=1 Tax=Parvularcula bermudensis (strain ATCC BAA-594 / HTCC2503 / KCTC 12087) TaxID=314260 RepID=E0TFP4_PARBH|nr:hemerythrin domain-containing protein [Parvularcula bermudensis]ADM09059.1 Hemerythrin [Parvularcula bermudensis HTCC2503]
MKGEGDRQANSGRFQGGAARLGGPEGGWKTGFAGAAAYVPRVISQETPMSIFTRLKQDHDRQRELIAQLCETEGDSEGRRDLWPQLFKELEAHALAEEQIFYAALMEKPDGTEKARHSVAEHKEMSDIAEELSEMAFSSSGWLTRFKTLAHKVIHHVDEEEEEVFPKAEDLFDEAKADTLEGAFDVRKEKELAAL